jgi:hypothetical protein
VNYVVPRSVHLSFIIDANRINSRQADASMNQLEKWAENGVISLIMSESSYDEARAGGNQARARKVLQQIFTMTDALTDGEKQATKAIESVLFPTGAQTDNERNDVDIVFNARKYRRILITADGGSKRQPGGILGNRAALLPLGVTAITAPEAVQLVKQKIHERDDRARRLSREDGTPLAEWVASD